jgi:ADP-heptose:LPS heptosyltransferase
MKKCLLVRLSSLGDVALSSVVIDPLVDSGYEPYLLTFEPYDELFRDDSRVSLIPAKRDEILSREFIKKLKDLEFELYFDLHRNFRTFLLRFYLRGRWFSYVKDSFRRRLAVRFEAFRREFYVTEAYLKALEKAGIKVIKRGLRPRIEVKEERVKKFAELSQGKGYVVIAPGARYKKKRYPRFREVAEIIREEGFRIIWVGDERDKSLVPEGIGENLCGKLSLIDLLALLKGAAVFVGNDSGPLHCARAVGTPSVQIFGGTHPTLGFSLYPKEGEVLIKGLDCQPCDVHGKGSCRYGDYRCLDIDPGLVAQKTLSLIRNK